MSLVYRVLRKPYAGTPFDGEGSFRFGGRWSSPGVRLTYASEHQSLAMLEYFVHLDKEDPPADLALAIAEVPDELVRERLDIKTLPANWRDPAAPPALTRFGDEFVQHARHCVLLVPSVLAPSECNYLMNLAHPDFTKIVARNSEPLNYDLRMFAPSSRRGPKEGR